MTAILLSGCGPAVDFDAEPGAAFRHHARDVLEGIDPVCPMTKNPDLLEKYDPIRKRLAALKRDISGTRMAADLEIAEYDEKYRRSVTLVECVEPDGPNTERYFLNGIGTMMDRLNKMEAIAQKGGTD